MHPGGLGNIFSVALSPDQRARHGDPSALDSELERVVAAARAAWPGVELSLAAYVTRLAAALSRPDNAGARLSDLHTDDLYLACACATGDHAAIVACSTRFGGEVRRGLGRLALPEDAIDEIGQRLRERLFVAGPRGGREIADYAGRGRLGAWMRVVAVRLALKSLRGQRREQPLDEDALHRVLSTPELGGMTPEQEHMKVLYRQEFKIALRGAIQTMNERDRVLLHQHFIEGKTIDEIGRVFDVHRATAARWINRARGTLIRQLRRTVREQLQLDDSGYDSLVKLVQSQLDLSVSQLLTDGPAASVGR